MTDTRKKPETTYGLRPAQDSEGRYTLHWLRGDDQSVGHLEVPAEVRVELARHAIMQIMKVPVVAEVKGPVTTAGWYATRADPLLSTFVAVPKPGLTFAVVTSSNPRLFDALTHALDSATHDLECAAYWERCHG